MQEKTGVELEIPIHPRLRRALDAFPKTSVSVLGTTLVGLGNLMAAAIDAAELPKCYVLHGLRKAAARRLPEAGATPHQIAAVAGHRSLEEIERYTKMTAQKGLAADAIRKISEQKE